jgi:hypothetical protein
LKGKRILIVSPFIDSIQEKIPVRKAIYGVELFPECTFSFLKPPQTQGTNPSGDFRGHLERFVHAIQQKKDTFDVALLSCGGYGIPLLRYFKQMGKSAIYIGGVLQMYFGVYGRRWLVENKDVLNIFLNKHWSRPKLKERPSGHALIEQGCYF